MKNFRKLVSSPVLAFDPILEAFFVLYCYLHFAAEMRPRLIDSIEQKIRAEQESQGYHNLPSFFSTED